MFAVRPVFPTFLSSFISFLFVILLLSSNPLSLKFTIYDALHDYLEKPVANTTLKMWNLISLKAKLSQSKPTWKTAIFSLKMYFHTHPQFIFTFFFNVSRINYVKLCRKGKYYKAMKLNVLTCSNDLCMCHKKKIRAVVRSVNRWGCCLVGCVRDRVIISHDMF